MKTGFFVTLGKLTTKMLGFRLAEDKEIEADWFVPHMGDMIRYHPDGCFAICRGREVVGMVTTTPYTKIGWIGWLYVAEKERGRGLGDKLMRAGIEHLQAQGIQTILLEAVVEATSLYKRSGFREQFTTQHYVLSSQDFAERGNHDVVVLRGGGDHVDRMAAFDRRFFHEDRRHLFEIIVGNRNFEGFVAEIDGRTAGLLFLTKTSKDRQVSPMVVDVATGMGTQIASALFNAAFATSDLPLYFRCPLVVADRSHLIEELEATPVDYHTVRMALGADYPPERDGVLSLGCPGKG